MQIKNFPKVNKKTFIYLFFITIAIKFYLSASIPITSDESLFYVWGQKFKLGYYDHPPLIGWILWLITQIDKSLWLIRLPATLMNHIIALGLISVLKDFRPDKQEETYLIASIYLLLPISILSIFITNDISLSFCSAVSIFFFFKSTSKKPSIDSKRNAYYIGFSGFFLGLAFLSKYLGLILVIPYLIILLRAKRFVACILLLIPIGLLISFNLIWNAFNCWQNILYNSVSRVESFVDPIEGISKYIFTLIYIFTPMFFVYVGKAKNQLKEYVSVGLIAFFPIMTYLFLSFKQIIGIHWLPAIIPALMLLTGLIVSKNDLKNLFKWVLAFAFTHVMVVVTALNLPISVYEKYRFYDKLSLLMNAQKVANIVNHDLPQSTQIMTLGYSTATNFEYQLGKRVPVFGMGSKYARHDDLNFDFSALAGKNIRIFDNDKMELQDYLAFFERAKLVEFDYAGVHYWYVDGEDFKYAVYRERVLDKIAKKYYANLNKMPYAECGFLEKYNFRMLDK
jgi:4-amino-4-deoxy-L-arabinose transferase-like glycosyltransferase